MTLLGREIPDLPAEVLFTDLELDVLTAFANSRRDLIRAPQPGLVGIIRRPWTENAPRNRVESRGGVDAWWV